MAAGVSQATLSKAESGVVELDELRSQQVAGALGVPSSLLASDVGRETLTTCVYHRKRSSTSVSQARWARAHLGLLQYRVKILFRLAGVGATSLDRHSPTPDEFTSAEDIARDTRKLLGLDVGPISDLVSAMEDAGIAVVSGRLGSDRLDALSSWPMDGTPVILINSEVAGERQRFTAAHELAHAVMHSGQEDALPADPHLPGREPDKEREADRFAAELLFPSAAAREELQKITLDKLPALKKRWRLSRSMIVRRARDVGAIGENQYRRMVTEMSAAGWRTGEPDPLEPEHPELLERMLAAVRCQAGDTKVANALQVNEDALDEVFRL